MSSIGPSPFGPFGGPPFLPPGWTSPGVDQPAVGAVWFGGPTLIIEAAFTTPPTTSTGSSQWTDITAYVRGLNCFRGRTINQQQFSTGTLQLVLDNRDRRFDPNYPNTPYTPNVLPMRRVRFRSVYNGVTFAVWSGFVLDWPQSYEKANVDAWVSANAVDGFKVLSLLVLPDSVWAYQLPFDGPTGWWRLGESSGTIAADSSGNGWTGTYVGGATFDSRGGLIYGTNDTAIGFDGVDDGVVIPGQVITAFPVTIECWVEYTTTATGWLVSVPIGTKHADVLINVDGPAGSLQATINPNGALTGVFNTITTAAFNDGKTHHVVAVFNDGASSPTLYIDGQAVSVTNTGASRTSTADTNLYIGTDSGRVHPVTATIDEVAVYARALTASQVATHYGWGATPWVGDDSGARINRTLDTAGWPTEDRVVDTGIATLQAFAAQSTNALSAMQTIEASEQGQLYIDGAGKLVFRNRRWRFSSSQATTSNATFGDGPGELAYADIVTDGGEQFIVNHVRAQRSTGSQIDVKDATSIATYYERTDATLSGLQNQTDGDVYDIATWRLHTRRNPIPRVVQLVVKPRSDPTNLYPQVLGRDIGDRVIVNRRPQGVGGTITYTGLIEGISHNVTADGDWTTSWYLSSFDVVAGQPLIFDDAVNGLFDVNTFGF